MYVQKNNVTTKRQKYVKYSLFSNARDPSKVSKLLHLGYDWTLITVVVDGRQVYKHGQHEHFTELRTRQSIR